MLTGTETVARAQPPQLTEGHANNPGQQGGDDCSESKIDLLVLWRANVPPHVLVLFFTALHGAVHSDKDLTAFGELNITLLMGMSDVTTNIVIQGENIKVFMCI